MPEQKPRPAPVITTTCTAGRTPLMSAAREFVAHHLIDRVEPIRAVQPHQQHAVGPACRHRVSRSPASSDLGLRSRVRWRTRGTVRHLHGSQPPSLFEIRRREQVAQPDDVDLPVAPRGMSRPRRGSTTKTVGTLNALSRFPGRGTNWPTVTAALHTTSAPTVFPGPVICHHGRLDAQVSRGAPPPRSDRPSPLILNMSSTRPRIERNPSPSRPGLRSSRSRRR